MNKKKQKWNVICLSVVKSQLTIDALGIKEILHWCNVINRSDSLSYFSSSRQWMLLYSPRKSTSLKFREDEVSLTCSPYAYYKWILSSACFTLFQPLARDIIVEFYSYLFSDICYSSFRVIANKKYCILYYIFFWYKKKLNTDSRNQ